MAVPSQAPDGLEEMDIEGTYTSVEAANRAALDAIATRIRGASGARRMEQTREDGTVVAMGMTPNRTWVAEARYESGILVAQN